MILRRLPRWQGIALVFAAHVAFAVALGPVFFAPGVFEADGPGEVLGFAVGYWTGLVSLAWIADLGQPTLWIFFAAIAIWAGIATAFVSPVVGPVEITSGRRPLWVSVAAAALLGATLCAALLAAALEGLVLLDAVDGADASARFQRAGPAILVGAVAMWTASGGVWFYFLRRAASSRNPMVLDRMLRAVFVGTAVELVLGLPLYLMVRKKAGCSCATLTFLNLVIGTAALIWLCGPWTILLLTREARRNWGRGACPACGYPRRSGGAVCSECGTALPE